MKKERNVSQKKSAYEKKSEESKRSRAPRMRGALQVLQNSRTLMRDDEKVLEMRFAMMRGRFAMQ